MKKINSNPEVFARIRVIGIGGSGGNAVNHMISSKLGGVEFITANTDAQDLKQSKATKKIHLGKLITKGLGTGMSAIIGKEAAEESAGEIELALKGADLVFIASGMGGGTGTGASPVVAKIAKELGILTVAIVTTPFTFEGKKRMELAEEGIDELEKNVDAFLVIPNEKIIESSDQNTSAKDAFAMSDNVLLRAIKGISELITTPGNINVDFADIRTTMRNSGRALMGSGISKGEDRAQNAARQAIHSPLLNISIKGAKRVLFSISSKEDSVSMLEIQKIAKYITESTDDNARIIFGTSNDSTLKEGELRVTVIGTSFDENPSDDDIDMSSHSRDDLGSFTSELNKNNTSKDDPKFVRIGEDSNDDNTKESNDDDYEDQSSWFSRFNK